MHASKDLVFAAMDRRLGHGRHVASIPSMILRFGIDAKF
jgi:hypothetical protein